MPSFPVDSESKPIELVQVPPPERRVRRDARFAGQDEKKGRYSLPDSLESTSPVGYRTRLSLTEDEARAALGLLALPRPEAFVPGAVPSERALFLEASLGVLTARQSTNYQGQRAVVLGPKASADLVPLLCQLAHLDAPVLEHASHTWLVLSRPYRTPFTLLLTFVGHAPVASLGTVPLRAWRKRYQEAVDIPTIGYLQDLHLGILGDAMERAAPLASDGTRQANVLHGPFTSQARRRENADIIQQIEALCRLGAADRAAGWRVAMVVQVGQTAAPLPLDASTCRRLGANVMALRSERIQPGVNHEDKAPAPYLARQDMDVPDALTVQAGRAGYNAFAHWTGCGREQAKDLLLLERVDVLTDGGKGRLREIRAELSSITDRVVANLPLWADLPTGKAMSRNANRGRKAFALAGQRIYIGGLEPGAIEKAGLDWTHAIRAFGAAASRSALVAEISGVTGLPDDCDLLAGVCLMAGPVNQNDIGKQYYGYADLLARAHGPHATSLLVWTLKAKTVADPIGNEEQLLNARRKGALVDLRCGPHELVSIEAGGELRPMRKARGRLNAERAFGEAGNFVTDPDGREIPGNRGSAWPESLALAPAWEV